MHLTLSTRGLTWRKFLSQSAASCFPALNYRGGQLHPLQTQEMMDEILLLSIARQ
jgi:hypothetical protein